MKTKISLLFFFLCSIGFGQWQQLGLDIEDEPGKFGSAIALSADGFTVASGIPESNGLGTVQGALQVFEWDGSVWTQKGQDLFGIANLDNLGSSVSISDDGNTVAVGAIEGNGDGPGYVQVFEWGGIVWVQKGATIFGEAIQDQAGYSISMSADGNTVAIGAPFNADNGPSSGHMRIYEWSGTVWVQKGSDIDGESSSDQCGKSVSLSSNGDRVAVGSKGDDGNGVDSGNIRIYDWSGTAWVQMGSDIDGENPSDASGLSVGLSGDGFTVSIGASGNDGGGNAAGQVRVYEWTGTNWAQKGGDLDGEAAYDGFGTSVFLSEDGNIVAAGANGNDANGTSAGHVRVYEWSGTAWVQMNIDLDGETAGDEAGTSVALSSNGQVIGFGAPKNDAISTDAGHARVFEYCALFNSSAYSINSCDSYTVPSGDETYMVSGIYNDTILNLAGCDSVMTINVALEFSTYVDTFATKCIEFIWYGNTLTTSGDYTHNLVNTVGCDSVLNLHLTIATVDISVTQNGSNLASGAINSLFQWLDCDDGYAMINGETSPNYTATTNGNYAIKVTTNGCTDTSACYTVGGIGINDLESKLFETYPNPTTGDVNLKFASAIHDVQITVLNVKGEIVSQVNYDEILNIEVLIPEKSGVYVVQVLSNELGLQQQKVIKL